jgi:predicted peptidase
MNGNDLRIIEAGPLRYILSLPPRVTSREGCPVMCFLHGYDEAAPLEISKAITRHGPLQKGNSAASRRDFIVIAPQLTFRGDIWRQYAEAVKNIVEEVRRTYQGDPGRTYLTGFSFGGNGVFDLALAQSDFWAALWPVDPTRIPDDDPAQPVWLSFGEVSRRNKKALIHALGLKPAESHPAGDRLYLDQGRDHVGSAALAYRDDRIYDWLLSKKLKI